MFRSSLMWLVAAALGLRIAVLVALGTQYDQDPDAYGQLARTLRQQGVLGFWQDGRPPQPTALRPPLYPLLLAPVVVQGRLSPLGVAALQVTLGVGTVLLVERTGRLWQLADTRWVAAGLVACDPLLLHQSTLVMTETLAAMLAAACLLALGCLSAASSGRSALGAGLLLGLAILCRPTFAPWAALAAGLCLLLPGSAGQRLRWAATLVLAVALVLAPWIIRNQVQLGRPIWASTHGGYTLLLGNNPHYYDHLVGENAALPWDARELLDGYRAAGHAAAQPAPDLPPEVYRDQLDYQLALRAIGQQPGMFLVASWVRVGRLWSVLPRPTSQPETTARRGLRYLAAAWYAVLYGLAAVGLLGLGRRAVRFPWLWGLALCLAVTAMHTVYWSDLRMRAPLVPALALLAAAGCQTLTAAWRGWRKRVASR